MTVDEFAQRVAHHCDELQIESEDYFYTALNSALCSVLAEFPIVKSVEYEHVASNSQTIVKMSSLARDFASFSSPAILAEIPIPGVRPMVDGRLGQILFPADAEGKFTIFYNEAIPTVTRNTKTIPVEGERLELLVLQVAYRLLLIDESYDAAAGVKRIYDETAAIIRQGQYKSDIAVKDIYGWC